MALERPETYERRLGTISGPSATLAPVDQDLGKHAGRGITENVKNLCCERFVIWDSVKPDVACTVLVTPRRPDSSYGNCCAKKQHGRLHVGTCRDHFLIHDDKWLDSCSMDCEQVDPQSNDVPVSSDSEASGHR